MPLKYTFKKNKTVSPHHPAVYLRRKQPKKASQELGQAWDSCTTAQLTAVKMQNSRRPRNVM